MTTESKTLPRDIQVKMEQYRKERLLMALAFLSACDRANGVCC